VASHVRDLGGLAHERAKRRHVTERVTADDRREGGEQTKPVRWLDAQHPGRRAYGESSAPEQDDPEEAPSDPLKSRPDLVRTDFSHEPDEQYRPRDGGQHACDVDRALRRWLGHAAII